MLLLLIASLMLVAGIVLVVKFGKHIGDYYNNRKGNIAGLGIFFIIFSSLMVIVCSITAIDSYDNYADMKAFWKITNEQYSEAIEMYVDKAVLKIDVDTFTDFRYQGYQENIASLIKDLRKHVVWYNQNFVTKKIYKDNILISWLIFVPDDDMKLIKMR